MVKLIPIVFLWWWTAGFANEALTKREAIEKRIQPVGATAFQSVATPSVEAGSAAAQGKVVYEKYCGMCHAKEPMIPIGAPTMGDKEAWGDRLDKSAADLLASVINGLNAMPARGTCMECSDSDLQKAIQYMLPKTDD